MDERGPNPWRRVMRNVLPFTTPTMTMRVSTLVLFVIWLQMSVSRAQTIVYKQDGDLIIGGIIPVHFFNESTGKCQGLRDLSALRRVEAIHYAISKLNNDSDFLGDLTLGYEIYDTCSSTRETLKNCLNFFSPLRTIDNIIGVVGAQRSSSSLQATNLLGLYNISIVSFLSTSDELSDSDRFPYFLRTVPPDKFQVSVITDIMNKYQWKYVAFLYSDDSYGRNAEAEFQIQARDSGICIGYARRISGSGGSDVYEEIIGDLLQLKKETLVSVVVVFTQVETAGNIFYHASLADVTRDFIWIGSDGWGNYDLTPVRGAEESVLGAFTVVPKAELHHDFNRHFEAYLPDSLNPWMPEFLDRCNCTSFSEIPMPPYESVVIDSVHVIALALQRMKGDVCNETLNKTQCIERIVSNRRILRDYLLEVEFESDSNGVVSFTQDGDAKGRYDIRYLMKETTEYQFITNGSWLEVEQQKLDLGPVPWYLEETADGNRYTDENIPKSVCSDPCEQSQVKEKKLQDCCWACSECADNEIILDNSCVSCFFESNQTYMWPHPSLPYCVPLESLQLLHEVENVIFLAIALLGIAVEVVVAFLYIKNREKRLIRASSRELSYIILVGIFLAYVSVVLYCIPAHVVSCFLRRIVPSIATTFIYVSLLIMTIRLYRIFAACEKTTKRPQFSSPKSQVFLTLTISIIPVIWSVVWIFIHPPATNVIPPTKESQIIEKICVSSKEYRIGQLVWDVVVVLVNCYYAIRTRNLPANYNQTRFIAFSVFSTLIVLIAFAPAFFTTEISRTQDLYSALGYIIQPTVVLILIFIARIYAIYFVKEEDQQVISTRPSTRKPSESVPHPSPVRTVSSYAISGSVPATPRSDGHSFSDVFGQGDTASEPRLYKSTNGHENDDRISSDSIEINSVEYEEEEEEGEEGVEENEDQKE